VRQVWPLLVVVVTQMLSNWLVRPWLRPNHKPVGTLRTAVPSAPVVPTM
jgi:hypothetical protein